MTKRLARLILCAVVLAGPGLAADAPNLVRDASFESDEPRWWPEDQNHYYIGKLQIADAAEGRRVMELSGWHSGHCLLVSPAITADLSRDQINYVSYKKVLK